MPLAPRLVIACPSATASAHTAMRPIGIEVDAGNDFPRSQPQRRANLPANHRDSGALMASCWGGRDQFAVGGGRSGRHFASSFSPNRIKCFVSAASPALRAAAAMAAAACG